MKIGLLCFRGWVAYTLTAAFLICTINLSAQIDTTKYSAGSLDNLLTKNGRTTALSRNLNLPLGKGVTTKANITVNNLTNNGSIIGNLNNGSKGSFRLAINNGKLEGHSVFLDQKKAFKYSTLNGHVYVQETNINEVVCVDFKEHKHAHTSRTVIANDEDLVGTPTSANNLQSLPGATGCILLDFDGETVTGTLWNQNTVDPIVAAPSNHTDAEKIEIWEIVAEDLRPFNLNVTTNETVFNSYPKNMRMRTIITPTNTASPGSGGIAYVGSFRWNDDTPCWVFNHEVKNCGETASHEIGHTFGLYHDGVAPNTIYFTGHGNWAPIMGASYFHPVTQWSKGEYDNANNNEDDLAKISSALYGVGYRPDDHGSTIATATQLTVEENGVVNASSNGGVIEQTNDLDYFTFTTTGGNVILNFNTVARHGNLDILAKIYNSAGTEIESLDNPSSLHVSYSAILSAGTYYVSVDGTGSGNPMTNGYTDYASLGCYFISGMVPTTGTNLPPVVTLTAPSDGSSFNEPASINMTADASDPDGSILKVEFYSNGIKLGEDDTAPYSFNFSPSQGTYVLEARAMDNGGVVTHSNQNTITVNPPLNNPPTIAITSPTDGSTYNDPASITINANANDVDGTVALVEFFVNGIKVGEDLYAPYTFTYNTGQGNYTISAVATDDDGASATSSSVNVTVNGAVCTDPAWDPTVAYFGGSTVEYNGIKYTSKWWTQNNRPDLHSGQWDVWINQGPCGSANQAPLVSITVPTDGSVFTDPQSITIDASASDPDGTITKVEFFVDGNKIGEDFSAPYTINYNFSAVGTYTLTAVATDNLGATGTSAVVNITVQSSVNQPPTIVVTYPPGGTVLIEGSDITITADANDPDGNVAKVEFFVNGALLGTDISAPFTIDWNNLIPGNYNVYAVATDNDGASTTSAFENITVIPNVGCPNPEWQATAIYYGGDEVAYQGFKYRAKWWTQNQRPDLHSGQWDVWENIGACSIAIEAMEGKSSNESGHESATNTFQNSNWKIFPNPTNGNITFALNIEQESTINIAIKDLTGATVSNFNYHNTTTLYEALDLSNLTSGIYFINTTVNGTTTTKKLVIK